MPPADVRTARKTPPAATTQDLDLLGTISERAGRDNNPSPAPKPLRTWPPTRTVTLGARAVYQNLGVSILIL